MAAFTALLPAQTAGGATVNQVVGEFTRGDGSGYGLVRASVTSPAAVTGAATNNFTVNLQQWRGGAQVGSNTVLFVASSGNNLAVNTPVVVANPGVSANDGDVFVANVVQNGTGLAVPAGVVVTIAFA